VPVDRRTFVVSATLGTLHVGLAGVPRGWAAPPDAQTLKIDLHVPDTPLTPLGMPGLYPGRVVQVHHPRALVDHRPSPTVVRGMVDAGMRSLTGAASARDAWAQFISPSDVVGLKVNPSGVHGTVTSIALVREVIRALNDVGVASRNIVVYDRNSNQLEVNGYHSLLPPGVRVVGLDRPGGYDRSVYCEMDCFGERETRSYLAALVCNELTKIVNLPCLKEHNASGVTGCLKNLSYGSFDNVARTHVPTKTLTDPAIAVMCTARPLRAKSVLHIMDGLRAVYHSGPFAWNPDFQWEPQTLLVGTDPVAVDRIELEIVEAKRKAMGVPSLWDRSPENIGTPADMQTNARKNPYYRAPGHIRTASELGLGKWELAQIDHRRVNLT
jgi:uncharacterized protein (DUF362 family)